MRRAARLPDCLLTSVGANKKPFKKYTHTFIAHCFRLRLPSGDNPGSNPRHIFTFLNLLVAIENIFVIGLWKERKETKKTPPLAHFITFYWYLYIQARNLYLFYNLFLSFGLFVFLLPICWHKSLSLMSLGFEPEVPAWLLRNCHSLSHVEGRMWSVRMEYSSLFELQWRRLLKGKLQSKQMLGYFQH